MLLQIQLKDLLIFPECFTKLIEYYDRLATQWDNLMEELFGMGSTRDK